MLLRLLGGVDLRDDSGSDLLETRGQSKRLAVLAYLAIAAPSGFARRDTLLALFWPDAVEKDARRSLNQAIHYLRQITGDDAIISRGVDEVGVDAALLRCDALDFDDAVRGGQAHDALELYRGHLLEGLNLQGLPEFDEWLLRERATRARRAADAAWSLAEHSGSKQSESFDWGARAYALDPDEGATRRLMALHDHWGDRAGSIRIYEEFTNRLESEYGAEPSPETQAMIASIRARANTAMPAMSTTDPDAGANAPFRSSLRHRRRPWLAAGGCLALAVATVFATRYRPPAARDFDAGEAAYRAGRYGEAVRLFRSAVQRDTNFALAYYRLTQAANWTGDDGVQQWAEDHAVARIGKLPRDDSARFEAWRMMNRGRVDSADAAFRGILARHPDDRDAQYYLTDLRFHWGPSLGIPFASTLPDWNRSIESSPENVGILLHAARAAAASGNAARFDSIASTIRRLDPDPDRLGEIDVLHAFAFGDHSERVSATRELVTMHSGVSRDVAQFGMAVSPTLEDAEGLMDVFFAEHTPISREDGQLLLRATVSLARGHVSAASLTIDSSAMIHSGHAREFRAFFATLPFPAVSQARRRALIAELSAPASPDYPHGEVDRHYLLGVLDVRVGDTARARSEAALLATLPSTNGRDSAFAHRFARVLRAELALAAGAPAQGLSELGPPEPPASLLLPGVWDYAFAHERFLRAQLLESVGRDAEALRWYETFPDPRAYDLMFRAPALERRAALASKMGLTAKADAARRELHALLATADPGVAASMFDIR